MTSPSLSPVAHHDATEVLAGFALALRHAGVTVTVDRSQAFLEAAAAIGADSADAVYWAGRATLCSNVDELDTYDVVFRAWFSGEPPQRPTIRQTFRQVTQADLGEDADGESEGESRPILAAASRTEILRHRDVAQLSRSERAELRRLFGSLRPRPPARLSARRRRARRGEVDARRTVREQLRHAGEPAALEFRAAIHRPRRVVVLIDVSGSMGPYADSLLRWAHVLTAVNRSRTEVFTVGTRLTRVTRAMRLRDGEAAIEAAGTAVPDWSGGTRLGESFQVFLDRWGQRGVARGAVVVIMSDGWERGDTSLLAEQMQRLHRLAHRVVWVNPHQGKLGYAPVQSGIVAALPYVDDFIAGHSLAAFEEALEVVADA
jgi:uncharacterized protein with von Willebrand factor type A (vWA) domain